MVFFINKKSFFTKIIASIAFVLLGFFTFNFFVPQKAESQGVEIINLGDLYGWAWMGVNISTPGVSEGGGGWLRLNCKPDICGQNGVPNWGVSIDVDDTSPNYGLMSGYAYSSNYGWLSFNDSDISQCYAYDGGGPPRVFFGEGTVTNTPVRGWARFLVDADNYWDGCVSFSGSTYGTSVDQTTGALKGWAWGGNIVGWLSFQNPECAFCNTTVNLPNSASLTFWADQTLVPQGGGTILRWQAQGSPGLSVSSCPVYTNTSGYTHWQNGLLITPPGSISNISLPSGNHPVNNIETTTTYSINCTLSNGSSLPTQFVTVAVEPSIPVVPGCTDPLAPNYNPAATVNDGSCLPVIAILGCMIPNAINYNPLATAPDPNDECRFADLSIQVLPDTIIAGQPSYSADITWSTTNSAFILSGSCIGSFELNNNVQNLPGWTGSKASPTPSASLNGLNIPTSLAVPGNVLRFTIRCQATNGETLVASDIITVGTPSFPPPSVSLSILSPDVNPIGFSSENLPPDGSNITLGWSMANVISSTCIATSEKFSPDNGVSIGSNSEWNGTNVTEPGQAIINMLNPGINNGVPTRFTITCTGLDNFTPASASVNVCIQGAYCDLIGSSGIPNYQEI